MKNERHHRALQQPSRMRPDQDSLHLEVADRTTLNLHLQAEKADISKIAAVSLGVTSWIFACGMVYSAQDIVDPLIRFGSLSVILTGIIGTQTWVVRRFLKSKTRD